MKTSRAFYSKNIKTFLKQSDFEILGELTIGNPFKLEDLQRNAWMEEIIILKKNLINSNINGHIIFEYTVPRIGKRIDVVIILKGLVFIIEFKIGSDRFDQNAIDQVTDYALDLKNFHASSQKYQLIPILVATKANEVSLNINEMKSGILDVIKCNSDDIYNVIKTVSSCYINSDEVDVDDWVNSPYSPTPTIIEAAQALYQGHDISEISRNDASIENLNFTLSEIYRIIEKSKLENKKSICFITGVPGAGKTLAGLNIANERHKFDENEHAVFLSGNQPLVDVLQNALSRNENTRLNIKNSESMRKAKAFIQNIHHFRDDSITTENAPIEKVVIFDEAQRAWTKEMLSDFMHRKKGKTGFNISEPEFLISIMNRHSDWAVIICLIGGGQEINTGEAGLIEWFKSLKESFTNWDVYISENITDNEFTHGLPINDFFSGIHVNISNNLHLAVSIRSFRSENVANFVKTLIDADIKKSKNYYGLLQNKYPIILTRDLDKAKDWVVNKANGTERYGLLAHSGAKRLRACGIWVQSKIDVVSWFLNNRNDVRSSNYLEETATEFDVQGLELDWAIICWDANYRFNKDHFEYFTFKGSKWMNVCKQEKTLYLKNAYRVLLTRARQGMVIYIPYGDNNDSTRPIEYYESTYSYLKSIGLEEI